MHAIIRKINLIHLVLDNIMGQHSHAHRMAAGTVVMGCGVFIAKHVGHYTEEYIAFFGDGVGYLIHGIGAVPFVDFLAEISKPSDIIKQENGDA